MAARARFPGLPAILALVALSFPVSAAWEFGAAEDIAAGRHAFHHLDASGRQAIAVSAGQVALVWDDEADGAPRCRLALKAAGQAGFQRHVFGQGECFAPGVAALDGGRFAVIWEDDAGVNVAQADARGVGKPLNLAPAGGQGALAWQPRLGLHAAWSAPDGRWRRVWQARLAQDGAALKPVAPARPADPGPLKDDQMYPALAAGAVSVALAWEDRRHGHTVIFTSASRDGAAWSAPLRVSQNPTGRGQGAQADLGRGTGAMRPALAAYGGGNLALVWLDKRDFLSGYDVYAALSPDGGAGFGANLKAQDSFGDSIAQWHPAVAGNPGGSLVVGWDDERDGSPDIWLAAWDGKVFGENGAPPPAAGAGGQTDPVLALDDAGQLHLAWIERGEDGMSRLRYSLGRPRQP